MNPPKVTAEIDVRDSNGYPLKHGPDTRSRSNIESNGAPISAQVTQHTDNSNNKALPWAVMAALFGGFGFGASVIVAIAMPQLMRSETRAASAELRAEFADEIADARAEARAAGTDAALWKNRVVGIEAKLEAQHGRR